MKLTVAMISNLVTCDIKLNNLSLPISIAKGQLTISAESGLVYYLFFNCIN